MSEELECEVCGGKGYYYHSYHDTYEPCYRGCSDVREHTPTPARSEAAGGEDAADTFAKIRDACDMVSALCQPRGSERSREWIMSIPARPDHDPDLVIASALGAAERCIASLRQQLAAAREDAERLEAIERDDWAVCPQVGGGWVIETGEPTGGGDADVRELVRTRRDLRVAIDAARAEAGRETANGDDQC